MEFKGSKTEQNLKAALAGESIARNKYTYFAEQARKEGLEDLGKLFDRLAVNETTHAKLWYTSLNGPIQSSMQNLHQAAAGEMEEWSRMYPSFAETAREEGFEDLAAMFEHVADIERDHEKQFMEAVVELSKRTKTGENVQKVEEEKPAQRVPAYRCMFCGAVYEQRPDVCPVCGAIGSFESCTVVKR